LEPTTGVAAVTSGAEEPVVPLMSVDLLSVDVRPQGDAVVLACRGALDHFTAPRLRAAVAEARAAGSRRIVLDLSGLDFMDAGGIHLLEDARDGRLGEAEYVMVDGIDAVARPLSLIGARVLPAVLLRPRPDRRTCCAATTGHDRGR
jgi:anti-anti-sigma factor